MAGSPKDHVIMQEYVSISDNTSYSFQVLHAFLTLLNRVQIHALLVYRHTITIYNSNKYLEIAFDMVQIHSGE